jgi:hypothetical protein
MQHQNEKTRRSFLRKSLLISGAGLGLGPFLSACSNESGKTSSAKGKVAVRKNIAALKPNDPEVKLLKEAVAVLKKRSSVSPLDPMGWDAHGSLHATFCATSMYAN